MNIALPSGWLALALLLAPIWPAQALAGHEILIWPVDPVITGDQSATELWVHNRGDNTTLLQVRIFAWRQTEGREQYQTQGGILSVPSMVRLEAGQKQVIRLFKQSAPGINQELAYRIVLDEIPTPYGQPDHRSHALNFQMRYSIPLFVYGRDSAPDHGAPALSWRLVRQGGDTCLEITNRGPIHARLSKVRLGQHILTQGLFGYVLAHSSRRWPLKEKIAGQAQLEARVDNRQTLWRSPPGAG